MRIIILIGTLSLGGCSSMHMAQDNWNGQDKAQHFIASAILSAAGNEYAQRQQGWSHDRSAGFGLLFSISLGAGKEFWDSRPGGSGWSWKDFAWDVAGASTGYAVWQLASH